LHWKIKEIFMFTEYEYDRNIYIFNKV